MPLNDATPIDLAGIAPAHHDGIAALAQQMRADGFHREDPVRSTFALLGDRWSTLILLVLAVGTFRHAELRRALGRLAAEENIAQRVLTQKLRALERDGFAARHVTADVPPKVSYSLTPLGHDLTRQAQALIAWLGERTEAIHAARKVFDQSDDV